jgi:lipoic acid synthetase
MPGSPDEEEPYRVAAAVRELGLRHVIITSVTRDDLPDGGSGLYARVIRALRSIIPSPVVEVLIPDFGGDIKNLDTVLAAGPDVVSHNIETVKQLYGDLRKGADYDRSLRILATAKQHREGVMTKSAIILGFGEAPAAVRETLRDLRRVGCDFLAIGQYLRPTLDQVPVREFVPPQMFKRFEREAYRMGFREVTAGPLVRSSYQENTLPVYSEVNSSVPDE